MLLAAGALQYPTKKFLAALAVGRGVRYSILAYLGAHYGRHIIRFFGQYYRPTLIILIVSSVAASLYGLFAYLRSRKKHPKRAKPRTTAIPRPRKKLA